MATLPGTLRAAAVLTAVGCALAGCGPAGERSGRVTAQGAAPVEAEAVGSSLAGPRLRTPGDFPAPDIRAPQPAPGASTPPTAENAADTSGAAATPAPDPQDTAALADLQAGQTYEGLPGVGELMAGQLPETAGQVLVARGADGDATTNQLVLYERADADAPWRVAQVFSAHNGRSGWAEKRREGDGTSPVGVFGLTDAGGAEPMPDSRLPYTEDPGLRDGAEAVYGAGWRDVFDYVIAIDYNRKPGTPPTDGTRPLGWDAGGKIWLHVDHDSPTSGCVSVPAEDMQLLLRTLDPARDPHIIMGPAEILAR